MQSYDNHPSTKAEPPKKEMWALVPFEDQGGSASQPIALESGAPASGQPPPPQAAGPPKQPPKRRGRRSGSHCGSSTSSSSSRSSAKSSSSQPGETAAADGGTKAPADGGGRRRRKRSKERDLAKTSASSNEPRKDNPEEPDMRGSAVPDNVRDVSTALEKAAQEAAPPRSSVAASSGAPSGRGLEAEITAPPERGETKFDKTSVAAALSLPGEVLHRGTQLVALAATAADVAGVMATIEATAPHAAATGSSSKDAPTPVSVQHTAKALSLAPSQTPPEEDEECTLSQCFAAASALCMLSCMLVLIVFVVLPLLERRPIGKAVCDTLDCLHYASALGLNRMEADTDPCEDFGQLVCSAVTTRHRGHAWSTVSQMVIDWMENIESAVAVTGHEHAALERPIHLVRSCLHREGSDEIAIESFIQFVHNQTFAWPTDDEDSTSLSYSRALMALIELAVRWALPLWFRIDLLPSRGGRNRTLTIKPSTLPVICEFIHQELIAYEVLYPHYVRLFNVTFFMRRKPSSAYQAFMNESAVVQSHILANLSHAIKAPIFVPRLFELQQLPSLITQLKADDWVDALQSVFNASPPIKAGDVILATNGEILDVVGRLFAAYDAEHILHHTAWWFLQLIGGFTSNRIFNSVSVSRTGKLIQKMMCASQVEATDYVLLAAVSQTMFPSEQRRSIRRHLERVHATAVEKVRASAMTASPVKEALLSFLQRTTTVTWPEEAFTPQNDPSSNYSQSTSAYDDGNVFTWWRSLRERLQRSMVSQQQAAIAKLPRLDTRAVTWYDPVLDVISVSYTALAPPLYYKRGTSAMLYGGIGFIYAREIAQALGVLTTLVDDGGHIIAPSDRAMSFTLWNNMTCPHLEPSDVETMFPSLPALEIAHAVYLKYRDPKYDLPVKGLEKYTAEQIFFITFCLATCHVEFLGMGLSRFCNSAVENFQPFARAFSCPPGSRMNLERKCRVF